MSKRFAWPLIVTASVMGLMARASRGSSEEYYETTIKPRGQGKFKSAEYRIWIPEGAKVIRAVIVHQHGCGRNGITIPYDLHWRALARKWDCALMGSFYQTNTSCSDWSSPENGSADAFVTALKTLAQDSNHPELTDAPWVLWGHSGGAHWVMAMVTRYPDRVVAAFPRSLPWGAGDFNVSDVPVLLSMGLREKEDRFAGIWKTSHAVFRELRRRDAMIALAIDPKSSHDCRNSRLLAIPFFDACLDRRLPAPGRGPVALKPLDRSAGWLGDMDTLEIAPAADYRGEKQSAAWLPDEATAERWREFAAGGWVTDRTPPLHAPSDLRATKLTSTSIQLTWNAQADLESGIKTFYYYRNGKKIGQYKGPVDKYHNPDGRFQKGNYGDEPTPEALYSEPERWRKPQMRFTDTGLEPGVTYTYTVTTVNFSDLESAKSAPLTVATTRP